MNTIHRLVAMFVLVPLLATACAAPKAEKVPITATPTPAIAEVKVTTAPSLPERDDVTITFVCRGSLYAHYESLAKAFHEEYPAIFVQLVSADQVTDHPQAGSSVVVSSDDAVKIAHAADTFLWSAGIGDSLHIVLDLTELAAQDATLNANDFHDGVFVLAHRDGKLWGLPNEATVQVLFYRPELFDDAGVPYPHIGWSWDDFLEAANRLTIRKDGEVVQYGYVDPWPARTLFSLAYQKIGRLVDRAQDPPEVRLDRPGAVEALSWYADLAQVYDVMPNLAEMDKAAHDELIHNGSAAMWTGGSREINTFVALYDADIAPLPEAGEPATTVSASSYYVSAGTEHPHEAWRWIEFLTHQPLHPRSNHIPARKSVAEEVGYWQRWDENTITVLNYCLDHGVAERDGMSWLLEQTFLAVLKGESVEDALAEAQDRANGWMAMQAAETAEPKGTPTPFTVATPVPTPGGGEVVIRFLPYNGADLGSYRALARRFEEEHPGIVVEILSAQYGSLADNANVADCFVAPTFRLQYEGSDAVLSLDPFIEIDTFDLDVFHPTFVREVRIENRLLGLPLETDTWLLYYNRDPFDAADLSYPSADWTAQDFVQRAIALSDAGAAEPAYGYWPREGAFQDAPRYIAWLGGQLFDDENRPTFDDPTVVDALSLYADLIRKAVVSTAAERRVTRGGATSLTVGPHPGLVSQGRTAMWNDYYSNHGRAGPLDFEVGVAPLPIGAVPLSSYYLPRALFISAETAHPQECWAWLKFFSAQSDGISLLPARRDIAASAAWRNRVGAATADAWQAMLAQESEAEGARLLSTNDFVFTWLDEALEEMLGALSPDPVAALAQAQSKAIAYWECHRVAEESGSGKTWQECAKEADPDVVLPEE